MAEINPVWLDRVRRAQQLAAARLGVEESAMLPPRDGSTGESAELAPSAAAAAPQPGPAVVAAEEVPVPAPESVSPEPVPPEEAEPAPETPLEQAPAALESQAPASVQSNGSRAAAVAERVTPVGRAAVLAGFETGHEGINRREFMSYAWGGALTLLTLESGLATYEFMYPRFREGEFGGKFPLGEATALPQVGIDPEGIATGKFWLINTDEGPRALYMVCTHLGCLYKWSPSNNRFQCPCHASQFSREGHYIRGPASRSLDQFVIEIVEDGEVVAQTEDAGDTISAPKAVVSGAEIVVNTGKRIRGKPAAASPARSDVRAE